MTETPKTDRAEFCILDCRGETHDVVGRAFARELERKNNELVEILARSLAELPVGNIRTHTAESMPERVRHLVSANAELERDNARMQMELDASCNAEELRQYRHANQFLIVNQGAYERENARLKWLIRQVTTDLPVNRDWLNPDYEREMRSVSALPNV